MTMTIAKATATPSAGLSTARLWLVLFAGFAALYLLTAQRSVGWQDSGMFQWRVLQGDYQGRLGLALAHPSYILAGMALSHISREHLPWLLNCFNAVGMALAMANLAVICRLLTGRWWIGLCIAAMLGVAHTPWWMATISEESAWTIVGLTAEIWLLILLVRTPSWRYAAGIALINGLGLTLHNFALLPLPIYIAVVIWLIAKKKLPAWSLAVAAGAYILGGGLYIIMTVQLALKIGLIPAVISALVGGYAKEVLNVSERNSNFLANMALTAMNFFNLLLPLAVIGWTRLTRRLEKPLALALGCITLIEVLFFVRYSVPDQFTFALPSLVMIALAAAVGMAVLCERAIKWRRGLVAASLIFVVLTPLFYSAAAGLARQRGLSKREKQLAFRDEARYWIEPWKHNENSAADFAKSALRQANPNGVIFTETTSEYVLRLAQLNDPTASGIIVQGQIGPLPYYDQNVQQVRQQIGDRPVFAVSSHPSLIPAQLSRDMDFSRRDGDALYRGKWK